MNRKDWDNKRQGRLSRRQRLGIAPITFLIYVSMTWVFLPLAHGAGGDLLWQAGDSRANMQTATAGVVDKEGNIIITGSDQSGSENIYTAKLKADGSGLLWSASKDLNGGTDQGTDVVVDGNGDVVVCGYGFNGINYDIITIKYNGDTGAVIWQSTFNGAASGHDLPSAITVDNLNNVYVGGYSQNASGNDDLLIIKFGTAGPNPDGSPLWTVMLDASSGELDRLTDLTAGLNGIAATGHTRNGTPNFDYLTVKYGFDGTLIWQKKLDSGSGDDLGKKVAMDAVGNVIVTGIYWNGANNDIRTVKYLSANGTVDWTNTYNGPYADEPKDITVDAAGDAYLTGVTYTATGFNDIYTARITGSGASKGQTAWQNIYNSTSDNTDIGISIVVDEVGDVYVSGYTHKNLSGDDDFKIIKYKRGDGTILWQSSFNGAADKDDKAIVIGLSSAGDLFVGGWSDTWTASANDYDFYGVKLELGLINSPTGLSATTVSESEIALTWQDNSANEDGFKIERKTGEQGIWQEIATAAADATTYSDTGLTAHYRYYYRIRAYNSANGDSHNSNEVFALTTIMNYVAPTWSFFYNGPQSGNDFGTALAFGPDNNPVVTGYSYANPGGFDYLTIKLNRANATEAWSHRYDDVDSENDMATGIAVDSANNVYVTGYSSLYGGGEMNTNDLFTIKYSATGPPQFGDYYSWIDRYDGPAGKDDRAVTIDTAIDASNNMAVIGYGRNASDKDDIYIIKYSSTGTRTWLKSYDGGNHDYPKAVAFDSSGNIIVTGYSYQPGSSSYDLFTRKLQASNGNTLWTVIYDYNGGVDEAHDLVVDPDGNVYITGKVTNASGNTDYYTAKYSAANGTKLWDKVFNGSANGNEDAVAITRDPYNGDIVVAGSEMIDLGNLDFNIIKYDADGTLVWQKTLDHSGTDDQIAAMAMDTSGNFCVTGTTYNGSNLDVLAVKYTPEGEVINSIKYNGTGNGDDKATAIAINSLNEMFVVGETSGATSNKDYLVLRCDGNFINAPYPFSGTTDYTSASVSWTDKSSDEDGFYLQRKVGSCSDTGGTWDTILTSGPGITSYLDTGLSAGATYCYQVQAFQNSGATSRWIQKEVVNTLPPAPTGLNATAINTTQVNLTWADTTTGEDGFRIMRCLGASCTDYVEVGDVGANVVSFSDTSVCQGQTYGYRVFAHKSGLWSSAYSNAATASTPAFAIPTALNVSRISEGRINLVWNDANSDHSRFTIYRCEGSGCSNFAEIATTAPGTKSYSDYDVIPDTTYNYQVTAEKDATCNWESTPSTSSGAEATLIGPSSLSAVDVNSTQINLSWTDNTSYETGTIIERCQGPSCDFSSPTTFNVGANVTSYSDTSVCNGTSYSYRIKAERTSAPSYVTAYSNTASDTTVAKAAPTALVSTRVSEGQINLSWSNTNTDHNRFTIYRCEGSGCSNFAEIATQVPGTSSYSDFNVTQNVTYNYQVTAEKDASCGWESAASNSSQVEATLLGPSSLSATEVNTTQINLTWTDNTSYETGFVLERCEGAACDFSVVTTFNLGSNVTSSSDTTVCNGIAYRYRIKAKRTTAPTYESAYSNIDAAVTVAKQAPTALNASRISEGQINVSWSNTNTDHSRFKVYRCEGASCTPSAEIATTAAGSTNYSDFAVAANTTYNYKVTAEKDATPCGWESDASNVAEVVASLTGPSDLTATAANTTQIDLAWTDNTSYETGTIIERCTGAGCDFSTKDTFLVDANVTVYSDTTVSHSTSYSYRVKAEKTTAPAYVSQYSNTDSATSISPVAPGALTATRVSELQIDLGWSNTNTDHSRFTIYRCDGASCTPTIEIGTTGPAVLAYSDTNVEADTTYRYKVTAEKDATPGSWEGPDSTIAEAVTSVQAPDAMTATVVNTTGIDLTWADNTTYETGFVIERCEGAGCDFSTPTTVTVGANVTSYSDTALCKNTSYSYRVKAQKNTAPTYDSVFSNPVSGTTETPTAPTLSPVSRLSEENIQLTWVDNTNDETGFAIERCEGANCDFSTKITIEVSADQTSYTNQLLTPDTTYRYQVKAVKDGVDCPWSSPYSIASETTTTLNAPSTLATTLVNTTQVDLTWVDNTAHETNFVIERCIASSCSYAEIDTLPADTTSYSDTGACSGETYNYRVKATSTTNSWESAYSNIATDTTLVDPAPSSLTVTVLSESAIDIAWTDNGTEEDGFVLERCKGSGCDFSVIDDSFTLDANATAYSDTGLDMSTEYSYRVKSVKNATCVTNSTYSNVDTASTQAPPAPTDLVASASNNTQIDLTWTDNTSYENGFVLERCVGTDCASFEEIMRGDENQASYSDQDTCPDTTYNYRVQAFAGLSASGGNGWSTKAPLTITNFQPNFQSKVVIPYSPSMQADFADIRFYDETDTKELPYWIESKEDGVTATVWFKTGGNNTVSLYFGNPTAAGQSNGDTVFELFDDFEDGIMDTGKWLYEGVTEVTGKAYASSEDEGWKYLRSIKSFGDNVLVEFDRQVVGNKTGQGTIFSGFYDAAAVHPKAEATALSAGTKHIGFGEGWCADGLTCAEQADGSSRDGASIGLASDGDGVFNLVIRRSGNDSYFFAEDSVAASYTTTLNTYAPSSTSMDIFLGVADISDQNGPVALYVDTIRIRKYAATEPVVDIGGTEASTIEVWKTAYGVSTPANITTTALAVPTALSVTRQSEVQVDLSWTDNMSEEESYRIERCVGSGCTDFRFLAEVTDSVGTSGNTVNYTDTGLDVSTTYRYRVYPYKSVNCNWTSYALIAEDSTSIAAPGTLSVPSINTTTANLSWSDTTASETEFEIDRCTGVACDFSTKETFVVAAGVTSYADNSLEHSTNYSYRVRSVNTSVPWNSNYGNVVSVNTLTIAVPASLTATRVNEIRVDLSWSDTNTDETNFRVERGDAACSNFTEIAATTTTSYTDNSLGADGTYCYRIRAYKTATNEWYTQYSATDTAVTTILAPANINTSAPNTTLVNVSWADTTVSETGFEIDRCAGTGCDFSVKDTFTVGAGVTSYGDNTVFHTTDYSYRVRAINVTEPWNSGYSNVSSVTTPALAPPTFLTASRINETRIDLAWQDNSNDESLFRIERGDAACSNFTEIATPSSNVTSFSDTGRDAATTYCYRIRGYKSAVNSWYTDFSNTDSATTTILAPTGLASTTPNTTQVNLTWTDNTASETAFEIDRCEGAGCDFSIKTTFTTAANATSYNDTTVCSSVIYRYQVRAVKSAVWASQNSSAIEKTTPIPSAAHTVTLSEVFNELADTMQFNLTWKDDNADENGFSVQRCAGVACEDFVEIYSHGSALSTGQVAAYSDDDAALQPSTSYCYRIAPYKSSSCSWDPDTLALYSEPICNMTRPEAPSDLTATAENSLVIRLDWVDNATDEDFYEIEKLLKTGKWVKLVTIAAGSSTYRNTFGVNPESSYIFRVRAIRGAEISAYSNQASATTPAYQEGDNLCP